MGIKYSEGKDYKVIAFVSACFSKEDQQEMIKRVATKCTLHKCRVVFFSTLSNFYLEEQSDIGEKKLFDLVPVEKFDAIVLMAETFKEEAAQRKLVARANMANVPVIAVDRPVDGCINVSFDYKDAFRKIVEHMIVFHGYRKINFMAGMPDNSFSDERIEVFKEVLTENGGSFEPDRVYYGHFWEIPTEEAMDRMLAEDRGLPEAIICANDTMALTVCDCLKKRGFRVPEDVAVSGFDGIEAEKYHQPRLLTSAYDIEAFADALFGIINDENLQPGEREEKILAYQKICIGGSCGCESKESEDAASTIIKLKSDMYEQMEYQTNLGRMVANYGNGEGMDIIQTAIPKYLKNLNYNEFWYCSESRMLIADYPTNENSVDSTKQDEDRIPELVNAIHYENLNETENIEYVEKMPLEHIVPRIDRLFDAGSPLLVVAVPSEEDPTGYAVVHFDIEKFWYTAYASFIFHFRFLLEMQRSKKMVMKVYRNDSLTGIYNRNGFYAKVDQIMQYSGVEQMTIISLDMYQFKQINDTYGHAEGDEALRNVGRIIRESINYREIAARIGGDEFLILLFRDNPNQEERAKEIIASIREKAEDFNGKNEKGYKLIFSIGTCTEDVTKHSMDYFLREADRKMYEHKSRQRAGEGK